MSAKKKRRAGRRKAKPKTVPRTRRSPVLRRPASRIYRALPMEPSTEAPPDLSGVSYLRRMEQRFEMSLTQPRVSVVVVARNEVDRLWHCLFALKTQTYAPEEIILVDNASEDATLSFVRSNYPQVKVLECQEPFGQAMAFNLGAKTATGDLVAIVEAGVVVKPDWLQKLVKGFQANWPKFGILASYPQAAPEGEAPGTEWDQTVNFLGRPIRGYWSDTRLAFFPPEGAFLYPRFLAPEGPFEEEMGWFGGGVYIGWKMRLLNRHSGVSPEAKIFRSHEAGEEEAGWKKAFWRTRNRWLSLLLFLEKGTLLRVLPWMAAECGFLVLRGLVLSFSSLVGALLAAGWILTHPRWIRQERRALQERRKVPDRPILALVSGRVVPDGFPLARFWNFLSLGYCRAVGLRVLEWQ